MATALPGKVTFSQCIRVNIILILQKEEHTGHVHHAQASGEQMAHRMKAHAESSFSGYAPDFGINEVNLQLRKLRQLASNPLIKAARFGTSSFARNFRDAAWLKSLRNPAAGGSLGGISKEGEAMKWRRWQLLRRCICLSHWVARGGTCGWCSWALVWRCVHTMSCSGWATCHGGNASPGASFGGTVMPCPTVPTAHMQVLLMQDTAHAAPSVMPKLAQAAPAL